MSKVNEFTYYERKNRSWKIRPTAFPFTSADSEARNVRMDNVNGFSSGEIVKIIRGKNVNETCGSRAELGLALPTAR